MKNLFIGLLILGLTPVFASDSGSRWDLKNADVAGLELSPPRKINSAFAPPTIWFNLEKDSKSVAVSLCGPDIAIEVGASDSQTSVGQLSVQQMERLAWFKPVFNVISGKVILKVGSDGEKKILENELKEFQSANSCNYM